MSNLKLSVIIPAFNEQENLEKGSLDKVFDYLNKQKYDFEVIIVDDGSTDNTMDIVTSQIKNKKNFKLIKNLHGGKAVTVMTGLIQSNGDISLFTDMDQATPISEIEKFFSKFNNGFDVVIGSRRGREGAPLIRKLAAWFFSTFRNLILGLPFKDTQCGFKAFDREAIDIVFPELLKSWQKHKTKGSAVNAGFDVEMLFLAKKRNLKIAEVEVSWHHVGTERVQIIQDAFEAVKDMIRIRINDFIGKY